MTRWTYTKPYSIPKDTSGLFVGVTDKGRKIVSFCRNSEDSYNKLKAGLKPDENLCYTYKDNSIGAV